MKKSSKHSTRSSLLIPDERNLGGRNQITNLIYNHKKTLLNVKPTVKTFSEPIKQKKRPQNLLNEIVRFAEVFESFRRVNNVKFSNFTAPPKSYNLTTNFQKPIPYKVRLENYNHSLNLKSQKQRIAELDSVNQRKKNTFDHKAYPSLFFRRTNKSTFWCKTSEYDSKSKNKTNNEDDDEFVFDENDIEKMLKEKKEKELLQRHQEEGRFIDENNNNTSNHNKKSEKESTQKKDKENIFEIGEVKKIQNKKSNERPQSAAPKASNNKNLPRKENILNDENDQEYQGLIPIPKINRNSQKDYEKLKNELIEIIYHNKIYDADNLETLFGRTLLHNPQMEKEKMEEIFINVFEELEAGQN